MTPVRHPLHRGAATIVAAFALGGCAPAPAPPAATTIETSPTPSVGIPAPAPPAPGGPPLPQPSALTDVLSRLSDPAVPGDQKISLIENGTPSEAAALDRFAAALRDNGALPLTFDARDLGWTQNGDGDVVATVTITLANPPGSQFTYPMQFAPEAGSWQLTRQTADQLLALDAPPAAPAAPSPPPPAPPR
ncbi:hypothetical protein [Mycolicibacterium obuense]|uniref:Low molecular weight antigen MTB12-like C-terminal domain-containing protein n=1 Tax=Mycolicibacterium obuense TaxID=1807 RepID=A0A0J6WAT7_9MYCO|nr:hypothetical protein [Mycolicibacterium obuense]KMO79013.1 hypothetical protein MOBUDSM44075_01505 [Mycolicibacterium obuense]